MTRRKSIPLREQLWAALYQLGFEPTECELDHHPALALREYDEAAGDTVPAANDPRYLVWRPAAEHKRKTFGTPATTAGSDIHAIAKARRLTADQDAFRAALLRKEAGEPKVSTSRLRGRGFAPAKAQKRATGYRRQP